MNKQLSELNRPSFSLSLLPLMTAEAYADAAGIPLGVLLAQLDRHADCWPTVRIGKRRYINVALLFQQCAAREF